MSWLSRQYAERKESAESQVASWVPYSDQAYAVEPLYFLSSRQRPGSPVADQADALFWYGFGSGGGVMVERGLVHSENYNETFFVPGMHGPVELAAFDYHGDKAAIRHETFTYQAGRLDESAFQATWGCGRSRCRYVEGRLSELVVEAGESLDTLRSSQRIHASYDEGQLSRVAIHHAGSGETEVAYRAMPADRTIEDVEREFVERLVAAVPEAVRMAQLPGRPACLALLYLPGQFSVLPPLLAIPLGDGPDGIAELLHHARFHEIALDHTDPELDELAGFLDQQPLDDVRVQAILNEGCHRLNRVDWRRVLDVGDDFLVFATDLEHVHLEANLRAVTSKRNAERISGLG